MCGVLRYWMQYLLCNSHPLWKILLEGVLGGGGWDANPMCCSVAFWEKEGIGSKHHNNLGRFDKRCVSLPAILHIFKFMSNKNVATMVSQPLILSFFVTEFMPILVGNASCRDLCAVAPGAGCLCLLCSSGAPFWGCCAPCSGEVLSSLVYATLQHQEAFFRPPSKLHQCFSVACRQPH